VLSSPATNYTEILDFSVGVIDSTIRDRGYSAIQLQLRRTTQHSVGNTPSNGRSHQLITYGHQAQ